MTEYELTNPETAMTLAFDPASIPVIQTTLNLILNKHGHSKGIFFGKQFCILLIDFLVS